MDDSCKKAALIAVAGGYLLGRTKKGKLALVLGSVFAGRKLGLDPQKLISKGIHKVAETPQFEELSSEVKDQLMTAARTAVSALANRRIESLTDALRERTDGLSGAGKAKDEAKDGAKDEGEGEEEDSDEGEDEEEEEEKPEPPPRKSSASRASKKSAVRSGRGR